MIKIVFIGIILTIKEKFKLDGNMMVSMMKLRITMLSNIKIFEIFQIWDIFFLSLAMGYGYFVIKAAWKGVLYGEKKTSTRKHSTCVRFSFISIGMIIMSCLYWQEEVFFNDPQRISFGIFIISGTLIGIFYTVSVWIDLYKSKS